jgi:hypothetical protein
MLESRQDVLWEREVDRAQRVNRFAARSGLATLFWFGVLVGLSQLIAWAFPRNGLTARADDSVHTSVRQIRLGETEIAVATTEKPGSRFVYVNLHDDENTSALAGQDVLKRSGGRLVELRHTGRRLLAFTVQGKDYRVDPNRIFTQAGARATLETQSRYSEDAARSVSRFAEELLKVYRIDGADAVIALHNNTQGMYSALSYARGGAHAHDAEDVFIRDGTDPDDFFFVTERVVFDALKRRGHNVVLQDNHRVTDDGSLSVYCGKANVRYINVEADHGHLKEQTQMILDLKSILDELGPLKRAGVTSVTTDH